MAEAYTPEVGWALGDGQEHGDDPAWDAAEANALYDLLEREVVPEFYTRNEENIPMAWVERMRERRGAIGAAVFRKSRGSRKYTQQHYLPAAASYRVSETPVGEPWAGGSSIGSRPWNRNGARCASGQ